MKDKGTLTFFCGKMGAGKSIKSKVLAAENNAVLISEDDWLSTLYPNQIHTFDDYLKYSAVLKPLIRSHVQNILSTGVNVVLDVPANTIKQRKWLKHISDEVGCEHELVFLNLSDEVCLSQVAKRRIEQPERALFDTEDVFLHVTKFFEAPSEDEALHIVEVITK